VCCVVGGAIGCVRCAGGCGVEGDASTRCTKNILFARAPQNRLKRHPHSHLDVVLQVVVGGLAAAQQVARVEGVVHVPADAAGGARQVALPRCTRRRAGMGALQGLGHAQRRHECAAGLGTRAAQA